MIMLKRRKKRIIIYYIGNYYEMFSKQTRREVFTDDLVLFRPRIEESFT